jgi:hypothetical protein
VAWHDEATEPVMSAYDQEARLGCYKVKVVCLDCRAVMESEKRPMSFLDALALAEVMEHGHEGHALDRTIKDEELD